MGNDIKEKYMPFMISLFNMLLLLAVFFLGFMSAKWTSDQIRNYCFHQCFGMGYYDYWGNPVNVTENLTIVIGGD